MIQRLLPGSRAPEPSEVLRPGRDVGHKVLYQQAVT